MSDALIFAEFAVVLEPEFSLCEARRTIYAGLVALADALAGNAPPEKSIVFTWPDCIRVDLGLVETGWPGQRKPRKIRRHARLVFGGMIQTAHRAR